MTVTTNNIDVEDSRALSEPVSGVLSGSGGDVMQVWLEAREGRISALAPTKEKRLSNESQFDIPPYVHYDSAFNQERKQTGPSVTGQVKGPDGTLLQGFAELRDESGNTLGGQKSTWGIWLAADAPDGVYSGEDVGFTPLTFEYDVKGGLNYLVEDSGMHTTVNTQYGNISGEVLDAEGNKVKEAEINVNDQSRLYSADDGTFSTFAPSGQALTVSIANGSISETYNLSPGDSDFKTFQFGGVMVTVRGPGGVLIPEVPVKIDGETYWTNDAGEVVDLVKSKGDHEIEVLDDEPVTVTVLGGGNIQSHTYDGGRAIEVDVRTENGEEIDGLPVLEKNIDLYVQTVSGSATLVKSQEDTFEIDVAVEDPRFETASLEVQPAEGELRKLAVKLNEATTVTNYA